MAFLFRQLLAGNGMARRQS